MGSRNSSQNIRFPNIAPQGRKCALKGNYTVEELCEAIQRRSKSNLVYYVINIIVFQSDVYVT